MKLATAKNIEVINRDTTDSWLQTELPKKKGVYRLIISSSDVRHTSEAYAKVVFELYEADGVVLKPYMGKDSIAPFYEYGKEVFIQLPSANSTLGKLTVVDSGLPLWQHIANMDWSKEHVCGS